MSDQGNDEELVTTPGGPRRKDQVHEVGPGQAVARQADGTFAIVPQAHLLTPQLKALLDSGEFVVTPGGPRRKELVHIIQPGQAIDRGRGVLKIVEASGRTIDLATAVAPSAELPALGSGWITYAAWTYSGSNPITSFTTTWVVPPAPTAHDSQLIYLFNGLQDSPVTHILQPVLQWGISPDGGGAFWAVASWFVDSSGNASRTPLVNVNEGDTLTGLMTLTNQAGGNFSYRCEFVGLAGTVLLAQNINQLVMPVETLECYAIQNCTDYPHTWFTAMRDIGVTSANGAIAPTFSAVNAVTDCGQNTVVVSNASPGGEVDLWYLTLLTVPSPSVVTDLTRYPDHMDLFVVGLDGAVNSTFWDVNGGWFLRWFRLGDPNFGDGFTVPPQSIVSCMSRYRDHIDLFTVGRDAAVYSTFWDINGGWFGHWFRLADTNFADGFTVPTGSEVSCLTRFPDHIDLFVSGFDGAVYSTFWDVNGGWFSHWFRLADTNFGDGFTVPPGTPVSSLSRHQDHIDLFVSGRDGAVYSTFWDINGGWFNQWFRLADTNFGDGFTVPPGSPVTNLSRYQDHIDLFVSGRDGAVYSTFWDVNGGWFNHWFRLGDPNFGDGFTIPPGSPVSAMSRYRDHLDLFVAGRDGAVYSTFWDINGGWFGHWFRLGDSSFADGFTVPPGSRVSCMARHPDHIDLFVVGKDGGVYSTFWDVTSGWLNHWFRI